jgi:signal transduction histidine kinase
MLLLLPRMTVRTVVTCAFLVAALAASAIYGLGRWAARSAQTELLLVQLHAELAGITALQWEAAAEGEVEDKIDEELAEHRSRVSELTATLRADAGGADAERALALFERYMAAASKQFELLRAGRTEEAQALDKSSVDPLHEELLETIEAQAESNHETAEQAQLLASAGMLTALLLAAATVAWLFAAFTAEQRRKHDQLQRTLADLGQAQDQLVQSEKLAALGQLIAGIAHEINTPLGAIRAAAGNASAALATTLDALPGLTERIEPAQQRALFALLAKASREELGSAERRGLRRALTERLDAAAIDDARGAADLLIDIGLQHELEAVLPLLRHAERPALLALAYDLSRLQANAQTILQAVERAAKVVFALKSYARFEPDGQMRPVHLREGLETVLSLYASQLRQGVTVRADYAELPPIEGLGDELVQVWTNLIHNAVQAMNGHGTLGISVARGDARHAVVRIADSGGGIAPEVLPRIFDAFFTTKARGEGSGLGLHICHKIIARHQGRIEVQSEPGRTVFSVWLPLAAVAAPKPAAALASTHTQAEEIAA